MGTSQLVWFLKHLIVLEKNRTVLALSQLGLLSKRDNYVLRKYMVGYMVVAESRKSRQTGTRFIKEDNVINIVKKLLRLYSFFAKLQLSLHISYRVRFIYRIK